MPYADAPRVQGPRPVRMTAEPSDDYQRRVVRCFAWLKDTATEAEAYTRAIQLEGDVGQLVPVGQAHATDQRLIATLARWRELNMRVYPTQFTVTLEGTAAWLRDRVLAVPDRIMFLVLDSDGRRLGHCGLAEGLTRERLRLDNVVRGEPGGPPGIMFAAVTALLQWVQDKLGADTVYAPPATDNERVVRFLLRLGFRDEGNLIPLRKVVSGDRIEFVPRHPDDERPPDRYQNRLVYRTADADLQRGVESPG